MPWGFGLVLLEEVIPNLPLTSARLIHPEDQICLPRCIPSHPFLLLRNLRTLSHPAKPPAKNGHDLKKHNPNFRHFLQCKIPQNYRNTPSESLTTLQWKGDWTCITRRCFWVLKIVWGVWSVWFPQKMGPIFNDCSWWFFPNPLEKYAQVKLGENLPQFSGWNIKNIDIWVATTKMIIEKSQVQKDSQRNSWADHLGGWFSGLEAAPTWDPRGCSMRGWGKRRHGLQPWKWGSKKSSPSPYPKKKYVKLRAWFFCWLLNDFGQFTCLFVCPCDFFAVWEVGGNDPNKQVDLQE